MITREQFENSYIVNDHGELRDKYLAFAQEGAGVHKALILEAPILFVAPAGEVEDWSSINKFLSSGFFEVNEPKQLTLADFEEEQKEEEEMETPVIDWSQAPEGYDYWIEYKGTYFLPNDFHKLGFKEGPDEEVYLDTNGKFFYKDAEDLVIHKRPEQPKSKIKVKDYIRKEFKTRGEALDYFDSAENTLYVKALTESGYTEVKDILPLLGTSFQLFVLEERDQTWQDVAQEFIKNDPVSSKDKFVEDMFGDEFKGYHGPLKQLAKLIVENTK